MANQKRVCIIVAKERIWVCDGTSSSGSDRHCVISHHPCQSTFQEQFVVSTIICLIGMIQMVEHPVVWHGHYGTINLTNDTSINPLMKNSFAITATNHSVRRHEIGPMWDMFSNKVRTVGETNSFLG